MEQLADRISEKIHTLSATQLAEVERFLEALETSQDDHHFAHTAMLLSEPAFESVWSNPEDDAYDSI